MNPNENTPIKPGPDRTHLPHACGVYIMRDSTQAILYIGKANNLAQRVSHYFNPNKADIKTSLLSPLIRVIDYIPCLSEREALLLERQLIRKHQPFFNALWKDDKSYPYLKITLEEDFPRFVLTRRKYKDGGRYFGPYPKVSQIRNLLSYLWRHKFFPLRPCRWNFSTTKPLAEKIIHACIYYHTKECPAPCAQRVTPEDYRRIAHNAVLFFSGRTRELRRRFEQEMKRASQRLEYEKAGRLHDNILALEQIHEHVRVRAVSASDVSQPVGRSRAVTDLQRILGLKKTPHHIECFDVSHFQGRQPVASSVCFQGGQPCASHYRRYRIKSVKGIDDFASLQEAVERRYQGMIARGEGLPDLVLIDGGQGQLSAAAQIFEKLRLRIPLAALAKRLEEIRLLGAEKPMIIPSRQPALQLLQHLRDEAHRFAVSYHRLLRNKDLFFQKAKNS